MSFHPLRQARPLSHRRQSGIPLFFLPADPFLFILPDLPASHQCCWGADGALAACGTGGHGVRAAALARPFATDPDSAARATRTSQRRGEPERGCPAQPRLETPPPLRRERWGLPREPRRPHGAGPALPGSRCRSDPRLPRASPTLSLSWAKLPSPVQPSPAAPGSPRRERGSVPQPYHQRRPRRMGPRCPSRGRPSGQLRSGRGDPSGGTRPLPEPRSGGGASRKGSAPGAAAFGRALWDF